MQTRAWAMRLRLGRSRGPRGSAPWPGPARGLAPRAGVAFPCLPGPVRTSRLFGKPIGNKLFIYTISCGNPWRAIEQGASGVE
jgi:hypothetical protein